MRFPVAGGPFRAFLAILRLFAGVRVRSATSLVPVRVSAPLFARCLTLVASYTNPSATPSVRSPSLLRGSPGPIEGCLRSPLFAVLPVDSPQFHHFVLFCRFWGLLSLSVSLPFSCPIPRPHFCPSSPFSVPLPLLPVVLRSPSRPRVHLCQSDPRSAPLPSALLPSPADLGPGSVFVRYERVTRALASTISPPFRGRLSVSHPR